MGSGVTTRSDVTNPSDETIPSSSSWSLGLLVLLTLVALPSGFDARYLPWFCVELAGTGLLLWLWWNGDLEFVLHAWRVAGPLSAWLGLSAMIAAVQILLGVTESRFDTFRQLHFFAGGLLLIPLAARAYPALNATTFQKWAAPAASTLLVCSLVAGSLALQQPDFAEGAVAWWPFVYRNHYAAFVLLLVPVLCRQVFAWPKPHWGAAVGVVAGVAGVVSSASRSGIALLALALGAFGFLAWFRSNRERGLPVIATFIVMIALGAALANSSAISWRLEHSGSPLEGRLDYWQSTLRMIAERPLLGWGFGTWPDVYPQFLVRDTGVPVNHAHSDWLEYFAEGGVIPVLALAVLFVRSLWLAWRHPWFLGVPASLILAMVDYPLRLPILLLALVSLYVTAELKHRREASKKGQVPPAPQPALVWADSTRSR